MCGRRSNAIYPQDDAQKKRECQVRVGLIGRIVCIKDGLIELEISLRSHVPLVTGTVFSVKQAIQKNVDGYVPECLNRQANDEGAGKEK